MRNKPSIVLTLLFMLVYGCDRSGQGSKVPPPSAGELATFQEYAKRYEEQLRKGEEQARKVEEHNRRLDVLYDKWEEQARRLDALLDRWERIAAGVEKTKEENQ